MNADTSADMPSPARKSGRIFESYGWKDATDVAQRLRASLAEAGYEVWIDRENLRADDKQFPTALREAIKRSEVIVALLSSHSVRGMAEGDERASICYNELLEAEGLPRPIVPVRVQRFPGAPPFLIIKYRRIDWLDWEHPESYQKGVREIVAKIERVRAGDLDYDPAITFRPTNFAAARSTARDNFVGRSWLFSRLNAWLAGSRRCFLIEGVTGSGKTAFVAELLRRNPGGRILAYHFCSASDPQTLEPAIFVRSIAGMLARSFDGYSEQLWKEAESLTGDPRTMLSKGVLAPLHDLPADGCFYLVVDGLEEAAGAAECDIPQLLAGALNEFPVWLKLLVTTRPHPRIQRLFGASETCAFSASSEDQRMDVRAYVERRLTDPALQAVVGADGRARAITLVDDRAGGSFQYARSILDALRNHELDPRHLDKLPKELEGFYYLLAEGRFPKPSDDRPNPPDYRVPRTVLEILLAAREPLALRQLATLAGLDESKELQPALSALSCFVASAAGPEGDDVYGIAHKSIADWLISGKAGEFRADPRPGRGRLVAHCRQWRGNHETYALKHVIAHLLEAGQTAEALDAVDRGLFAERLVRCNEPRLDAEDSRDFTLALVAARDKAAILRLARTENTRQRDGVAAALQSTPAEDGGFIDEVVGALLELKP
jgi:TIR domain/NACHT domain